MNVHVGRKIPISSNILVYWTTWHHRWLKPSNGEFQPRRKFMGQFVGKSSDYWRCCHCHCCCCALSFSLLLLSTWLSIISAFVLTPFIWCVSERAIEWVGKWNLMMCNEYNPCSIIGGRIHTNTQCMVCMLQLQKITGEIIQLMWFDEARIPLALNFIQNYARHT